MREPNVVIERPEQFPNSSLFIPDTLIKNTDTVPERPAVLFVHGFGSNEASYASYATAVSRLGIICLTKDFSWAKNSTDLGKHSIRDQWEEVRTAFDLLASQPNVDRERMAIVAASYGVPFAFLLSTERPVASILGRAGAIFRREELFDSPIQEVVQAIMEDVAKPLAPSKPIGPVLEAVAAHTGTTTIVESGSDKTIRPHVPQTYYYYTPPNKGTYIVMPGAGHELQGEERTAFQTIMVRWAVKELLSQAA